MFDMFSLLFADMKRVNHLEDSNCTWMPWMHMFFRHQLRDHLEWAELRRLVAGRTRGVVGGSVESDRRVSLGVR